MSWQKRRVHVMLFIVQNMHDGLLPIDTYKNDVDTLVEPKYLYDWESLTADYLGDTVYGTQHCPHRCLQRAVPLCQMPQTESNHLEHSCPLKNQEDRLNRLFHNMLV